MNGGPMNGAVSLAEMEGQQVEFLPARTLMQVTVVGGDLVHVDAAANVVPVNAAVLGEADQSNKAVVNEARTRG